MTERDSITVPFADLGRDDAPIVGELRSAFERVLGSSGFILGQEVEWFESEFAAYCGTEHCIGISSGTTALSIMLKAAGVGPGDEVIVPAHTFIATALAVIRAARRWAARELSLPMFASLHEEEVQAVASALSQALTLYSGETSGVRRGFGSDTNHGRDQRDASREQWRPSAPAVQDLSTVAGGGECE